MPKSIILDADGVILNWFSGFAVWMISRGYQPARIEPIEYDLLPDLCPGLPWEVLSQEIAAFNESDAFGKLDIYADALTGISKLRATFPDRKIVVLTAAGGSQRTAELRRKNLEPLGVDQVTVIPLRESKRPYLAKFEAGSFYVDDVAEHAIHGYEVGHRSVLIERPWNKSMHVSGPLRAKNWSEIGSLAEQETGLIAA